MKINFITNDYLLAWNLLFGPSISEESYIYKQRLWLTYKSEYNMLSDEHLQILEDKQNYIPNNNVVFDKIFEKDFFSQMKREVEEYRLRLLKIFDKNKRIIDKEIKEILKINCDKEINVVVLHPRMDTVLHNVGEKSNTIVWAKDKELKSDIKVLMDILFEVVKLHLDDYQKEYKEVVQAVLELAINNELCTRVDECSAYLSGEATLKFLKKQIYPFWLMYLGANTEEALVKYMSRDKIGFDLSNYEIETDLSKKNIYEFIDFCIDNLKEILKIEDLEII